MKKKLFNYKTAIYIFLFLFSLLFIIPFFLLIAISFSTESDILNFGYSFIPKNFSVAAYEFVFNNRALLISSYKVTIFTSFLGTALSIVIMAMFGYALSREGFAYRKILIWFLLITMFFKGGIVPEYIINTQVFGLQNNILIYLVSNLVSAYTVFVFRTFFSQLPKSLLESAFLDGASEIQVLTNIIIPLSKPVLATFFMIGLLSRWVNFEVSLYYITDSNLYSLQYYLQQILNDAKMMQEMVMNIPGVYVGEKPPLEIMKFAVCILATIPMMIVFPFFQKYFAKGMVVGSVKG